MRAVTVRSKLAVQPARNGELRAGSMSTCWKKCRGASTTTLRQWREIVEPPFGKMKARMGTTHFLTKTLPKAAVEMALSVLAYNLTRVLKRRG